MEKTLATSIFFTDMPNTDPDTIDWEIMVATRKLAQKAELFNPAMYAATAGNVAHAHACEMSPGSFMIIDLFEGKRVGGLAAEEDDQVVIPNHNVLVIKAEENGFGYDLTLTKGVNVIHVLPGVVITFGKKDPHMVG